jgi:hypothetical protein
MSKLISLTRTLFIMLTSSSFVWFFLGLWGFTPKHLALVWPYLPQWPHKGELLWGYCHFCRKTWWGKEGLELDLPVFGSCFLIQGFWCRNWWQCGLMCPVIPQWWQVGWLCLFECFLTVSTDFTLAFLQITLSLPFYMSPMSRDIFGWGKIFQLYLFSEHLA